MSQVPEYTVRESTRARHMRLTMSARDGLVVVVPKGFNRRRIPKLLAEKRQWIKRAAAKIEAQRAFLVDESTGKLPETIALSAIGQVWTVDYKQTAAQRVSAREYPDCRLLVSGKVADTAQCQAALRRWLQRKAHQDLVPWLQRLANDNGFQVSRVLVKSQRTRWGSCSRQNTISLNRNLLLLPQPLAGYVLLHELCHTVHHDHSARFWGLVGEKVPDYRQRKKELKEAWRYLPGWVGGH